MAIECTYHLCFSLHFRLNNWIKAHAHLHSQEYTQAIQAFRNLDERTSLRDNVNILVPLGESYYYYGDNANAALVLQRVCIGISDTGNKFWINY